jgi:hypothetical protein
MALSYSFTKTAGTIIEEALRDARLIAVEEDVQPVDYQRGLEALNNVVTAWQSQDINLWTKEEAVLFMDLSKRKYSLGPNGDKCADSDTFVHTTLTAAAAIGDTALSVSSTAGMVAGDFIGIELDDGTRQWTTIGTVNSAVLVTVDDVLTDTAVSGSTVYSYATGIERPMRVLSARFADRISASETPMTKWSRDEYFNQPDKDTAGGADNWYYSPQLGLGELYIWPIAASVKSVLRFTYIKPAPVYSETNDALIFPSEFFVPLKWHLAAELGPSYGTPDNRQVILETKASTALEKALGHDSEMASLYMQPDFS